LDGDSGEPMGDGTAGSGSTREQRQRKLLKITHLGVSGSSRQGSAAFGRKRRRRKAVLWKVAREKTTA